MAMYQVVWTITVEAESPREAAREARACREPGTTALVFQVTDGTGATTNVDLDAEDPCWQAIRESAELVAPWDWEVAAWDNGGLYTEREDGYWIMLVQDPGGRWHVSAWPVEADLETPPEVETWAMNVEDALARFIELRPMGAT